MVRGKHECLLSGDTAEALKIITINRELTPQVCQVGIDATTLDRELNTEELKTMYPKLFSGKLGCLKNVTVKLDIDESVRPVRQQQRPVAVHLRDAVETELIKQVEEGILERVDAMGLKLGHRSEREKTAGHKR